MRMKNCHWQQKLLCEVFCFRRSQAAFWDKRSRLNQRESLIWLPCFKVFITLEFANFQMFSIFNYYSNFMLYIRLDCKDVLLQFANECSGSDVYWTVHHCDNWRIINQIDVAYYFFVLLIGSTRFGHYYAHHQELSTVTLITTMVVSFLVCCMLELRCGIGWSSVRAAARTPHQPVINVIVEISWWWA